MTQQDKVQFFCIVKACCILHNWLVLPKENIPEDCLEHTSVEEVDNEIGVPRGTLEGNYWREQILGYVLEYFGQLNESLYTCIWFNVPYYFFN